MNYRTILNDYKPIEQGDFMLRYKINGRSYVLFSPKKDVVSCIELYNFSEISPIQLALLFSYQSADEIEQEEFTFTANCTREQIIDYLFDVEGSEDCVKIRHTSGLQGYLMYDLAKADKVRNLFQFDIEKKASHLLFDNRHCAASLRGDCQGSVIHLCWNPCVFHSIKKGGRTGCPGLPVGFFFSRCMRLRAEADREVFLPLWRKQSASSAFMWVMRYLKPLILYVIMSVVCRMIIPLSLKEKAEWSF